MENAKWGAVGTIALPKASIARHAIEARVAGSGAPALRPAPHGTRNAARVGDDAPQDQLGRPAERGFLAINGPPGPRRGHTSLKSQREDGRTIFIACRGIGRPALLLSLAAAAVEQTAGSSNNGTKI